ncbi:PP2C family serine/threonine-protein phosphatase [Pseudonocardia kunmingensis]|uniref:PP2C family serine/threonine-protein phosphatase n=1 Tax=Pseudonocardia kunmingensis TaxID=630975 RepID=UPI001B863B1B|nr:protein phosphatase 2C domain-containing protein [Pseudonocardia kunmingensis]
MGCPECGEPVGPEDRFCEACGTDLLRRTGSTAPAASPVACAGCGEPASEDEYCQGCGLRRRDGTERVELDLEVLAGVSDRGLVHARNEDAVAVGRLRDGPTAAVVCDGVSSVHRPELASRAAADTALEALLACDDTRPAAERVRAAVAAAAAAVAGLPAPPGAEPPSCTLVCALVHGPESDGPEITIGWVGDSRAYWLAATQAGEPARLLTRDHAWAGEKVARGELDPAEAAHHPLAHAITRWLGADGEPEPDLVTLRPAGPGALLLCSDGLWNYLPDAADLAALALPVLDGAGPLAAATALTAVALDAGGRDNITVVVVPVRPRTERSS